MRLGRPIGVAPADIADATMGSRGGIEAWRAGSRRAGLDHDGPPRAKDSPGSGESYIPNRIGKIAPRTIPTTKRVPASLTQ
jgi:hypothetical protein